MPQRSKKWFAAMTESRILGNDMNMGIERNPKARESR
jgi:hypothetical protein